MAGKAALLRRKRPNPHHPFKSQRVFVLLSLRLDSRRQENEQAPTVMGLLGPDEKNPGGDLLLRDLSSDYHWRGSVSLPGSERDRVGPLRSGHRASGGRVFHFLHPACPGALGGL